MKRHHRLLATSLLLATSPALQAKETNEKALLVSPNGRSQIVWITNADKSRIQFKKTLRGIDRLWMLRSRYAAIYFHEPSSFTEAMRLYNGRNYQAAREAFARTKTGLKTLMIVPGNYATLSGFYELECLRKLRDYQNLHNLRQKFIGDALARPAHKTQLNLYGSFWDGVRTKSWRRIIALSKNKKWLKRKLTTGQRAQIAYALGLAYEGSRKPFKALNAFNEAFTADCGASEILAKDALLGCLRVIKAHPEAQLAAKLHGTEDEDPYSTGADLIAEAAALCSVWEESIGLGTPLPKEYQDFKKYKPAKGAAVSKPAGKKKEEKSTKKKSGIPESS